MCKRLVIFLGLAIFVISLSGCATGRKQSEMDIQGLRNQVSLLESQVQAKDQEISSLRDALSKASEEKASVSKVGKKKYVDGIKSRPNVKHIQTALENAGYNPGPINGHMNAQTKEAIKAFQKANNLSVDGRVGKNTWALLRGYLEKKIK